MCIPLYLFNKKEMVNFLETLPLSYDRYFTRLEEFTLKQLDSHQKANFVLKEKLVVLGNVPKVIVPSISQNSQPNLNVNYDQISNRAPVSAGKSLSKIVNEKIILLYFMSESLIFIFINFVCSQSRMMRMQINSH